MLRILAQVRCRTIARQGLRRQVQVAWFLWRKDARQTIRTLFRL